MRCLVIAESRMARNALANTARQSGLEPVPASLDEAVALAPLAEAAVLHAPTWDEAARSAAAALRDRRTRFLVVLEAADADGARQARQAGALYVVGSGQEAELSAILRNLARLGAGDTEGFILANGTVVDLSAGRIHRDSQAVPLSSVERSILRVLWEDACLRPGRPVPHTRLNLEVWGRADAHSAATVRGYIHRLRRKIEGTSAPDSALVTSPGEGYSLRLAPGEVNNGT